MRFFLTVLAFFALAPSAAFAVCGSPSGVAGEIVFNADAAVYVNGTAYTSSSAQSTISNTAVDAAIGK